MKTLLWTFWCTKAGKFEKNMLEAKPHFGRIWKFGHMRHYAIHQTYDLLKFQLQKIGHAVCTQEHLELTKLDYEMLRNECIIYYYQIFERNFSVSIAWLCNGISNLSVGILKENMTVECTMAWVTKFSYSIDICLVLTIFPYSSASVHQQIFKFPSFYLF